VSWWDLVRSAAVTRCPSPVESGQFGVSVERISVPVPSAVTTEEIARAVRASDADVVILRYPAARVALFAALATGRRTAILADTLTYWRLRTGTGRRPRPHPSVEATAAVDPAALDGMVADAFAGYGNHYRANPVFDAARGLAAYQDWARRSLDAGNALVLRDRSVPGAEGRPSPAGLVTVEEHADHVEVLLLGIVRAARGRSLSGHLLAAVEDRAAQRGAGQVVVSTQGHNTQAQRAWTRYGFEAAHTFVTAHLVRSEVLKSAAPAETTRSRQ
jgi:ribosomal protein S18 acetylase RimI-like enzyme